MCFQRIFLLRTDRNQFFFSSDRCLNMHWSFSYQTITFSNLFIFSVRLVLILIKISLTIATKKTLLLILTVWFEYEFRETNNSQFKIFVIEILQNYFDILFFVLLFICLVLFFLVRFTAIRSLRFIRARFVLPRYFLYGNLVVVRPCAINFKAKLIRGFVSRESKT